MSVLTAEDRERIRAAVDAHARLTVARKPCLNCGAPTLPQADGALYCSQACEDAYLAAWPEDEA